MSRRVGNFVLGCLIVISLMSIGTVLMSGPFRRIQAQHDVRPFDIAPATSTQDAKQRLEKLGEGGRQLYRRHLAWDGILIVSMAILLEAGLHLGLRVTGRSLPVEMYRLVLILPLAGAGADMLEDVVTLRWTEGKGLTSVWVHVVYSATIVKFLAPIAFLLIIAVVSVRSVWARRVGR